MHSCPQKRQEFFLWRCNGMNSDGEEIHEEDLLIPLQHDAPFHGTIIRVIRVMVIHLPGQKKYRVDDPTEYPFLEVLARIEVGNSIEIQRRLISALWIFEKIKKTKLNVVPVPPEVCA
jgi:hypothetical protein